MTQLISIKVTGVDSLSAKLRQIMKASGNVRKPVEQTLADTFAIVQRNFQTGGGAHKPGRPWKPLKASTIKQKQRKGYSSKPLIRTGHLRQAWQFRVTGNFSGYLESKSAIAIFHQEGTRRGIPAREMIPRNAQVEKILKRHLTDFLRKAI